VSGPVSYRAGLSAEDQVAADYARRGHSTLGHRWRGKAGEIDLIAKDGDGLIFVEIKKSRDFDRAAERLGKNQMQRIYASAAEYLGRMPMGQLTAVRFDVALVDERGAIRIIENAFGH